MSRVVRFLILSIAAVAAFCGTASASDIQWGRSNDAGNLMGYEYIQGILNSLGYSSINAKTDYTTDMSWSLPGTTNFRIEAEYAWNANWNEFGYYQNGAKKKIFRNEIFDGGDTTGAVASEEIVGNFGLYLNNVNNENWYTDSSLNKNGGYYPQALVYTLDAGSKWLVAWEDTNYRYADRDYQDMVVTVTATPEPAAAVLFIAGGGLLAALRLKKKRVMPH